MFRVLIQLMGNINININKKKLSLETHFDSVNRFLYCNKGGLSSCLVACLFTVFHAIFVRIFFSKIRTEMGSAIFKLKDEDEVKRVDIEPEKSVRKDLGFLNQLDSDSTETENETGEERCVIKDFGFSNQLDSVTTELKHDTMEVETSGEAEHKVLGFSDFVFKFEYQTQTFEDSSVRYREINERFDSNLVSSPLVENHNICLESDYEVSNEFRILLEKEFIVMGSDSDSGSLSRVSSGDGFSQDGVLEDEVEFHDLNLIVNDETDEAKNRASVRESVVPEESNFLNFEVEPNHDSEKEEMGFRDSDSLLRNELENNELVPYSPILDSETEDSVEFKESEEDDFHILDSDFVSKHELSQNDSNSPDWDFEDSDSDEEWMKELKYEGPFGLPTILEDCEFAKTIEELKPWTIDPRPKGEDRFGEIRKFYRKYGERMKKLDVMSLQKMYSIGVLQSKKNLFESISTQKDSTTFLLRKAKKYEKDPIVRFVKELQTELEIVYVGQLCMTWEILNWQYQKALQIWESDTYETRRFNEVAGEFQQFQVLIQRFIENERYEGPRVANYAKNRCFLRKLLQVPLLREDKLKGKRKGDGFGGAIGSETLVEIIEESIRLFWRFVRADKYADSGVKKSVKRNQVEAQDPADVELFPEIRTLLQKKEKKLKDIMRSGNCILKRFKKEEDNNSSSDHVLFFFSQVDMKLVARVLNMSKLTGDQLQWCNNKLSNISFVDRKLHVAPSFSLFPC